jgi:transposase
LSRMSVAQRMSQGERLERRKAIAAAVTNAASMPRVAAKFGVTLETVRAACRVYAPGKLLIRGRRRAPAA